MKKVLLLVVFAFVMCASVFTASAQALKVKGTIVYEEDNTPVIGATVLVVGTNVVAVSDIYGKYQITVPASAESKTLKVSYAGLADQEQQVTSNDEVIDFRMVTDLHSIEQVVVTGYGSARKVGTVVGSVQQVSAKELENRPSSSVMDALQGKVAGLQIFTSSGEPAAQQSIRLHGVGSLGAGSSPLYILDGIQVNQTTIQAMNPNDFESITVLKDASATSIYGSRAANGVIVYTTKRGKGGDAQINVRAQYGVSTQADTRFYDNMMSRQELWDFGLESGLYSEADITEWTNKGYNRVDTDWFRYMQKKWAPTYQADIAVAGGNQKTNYYISGGVFSQEGTAAGSYYDKMNLRTNIDSQVKDWLRMGVNVQLFYDEQNSNANFGSNYVTGGMSYILNPMYPTYNLETGKEYWDEQKVEGGLGMFFYNPEYAAEMMPYKRSNYGTSSSAYLLLEPIENLKIQSRAGLEFIYTDINSQRLASYPDSPGNGGMSRSAGNNLTATITNTVEYAVDIDEDNSLTFLVGQEGIMYKYAGFSGSATGLQYDNLMQLGYGKQSTFGVSSSDEAYNQNSFFGTVNYGWKDKLYLDASVRNDQSSKFAPGNRSATFWAAGAMFNFHEQFLKDNNTITNLSAKVSYGTQGNSSIGGNYAWQGLVSSVGRYNDVLGLGVVTPYNPDLQWETQKKLTVAAKISLWNRLNIDVEYYLRDTEDMIMDVPMPSTSGFSSMLQNVGGLRNEGVDFTVDYDILRSNDYYLNVGFNFNYNKQTITELFDGRDTWTIAGTGLTYVVGQSVMFYYPLFAGINPENGAPEWYVPGDDFTVTNRNETTTNFNEDALNQNTGEVRFPPIAGGFNVSAGWKGITLQADFAYVLGKYLINNDLYFTQNPYLFNGGNTSKDVTDYWREPGDIAKFPNWAAGGETQFDDHMLENASFLRLKNLTIGYNFPRKMFSNQDVVSGLKVYATGRNLFTVTEFSGIDPEVDSNLTIGAMPNSKQFVLGVELTF